MQATDKKIWVSCKQRNMNHWLWDHTPNKSSRPGLSSHLMEQQWRKTNSSFKTRWISNEGMLYWEGMGKGAHSWYWRIHENEYMVDTWLWTHFLISRNPCTQPPWGEESRRRYQASPIACRSCWGCWKQEDHQWDEKGDGGCCWRTLRDQF